MKMKHFAAIAAAAAISAVSFMALPASAADVSIAYSESGGSKATSDDGKYLRRNIYNVWGNEITDIDGPNTVVNDYVKVTFEVSGIGGDSQLVKEDESTEQLKVFLGGSIAGVAYHQLDYNQGKVPGSQIAEIHGDGQYTVTWENVYSENIDCLYLQSNINFYAYGENVEDVNGSNANIKVLSIVTGEAQTEETETDAPSATDASSSTTDSSSTANSSSSEASSSSSSTAGTTSSTTETTSNASTGDAGIALALVGLTAAGAAVLVSRKKD